MIKRLSKFKIHNLNFNYLLAAFVPTLNIGIRRRLRFIKVVKTKLAIRLLKIPYQEGIIRTFVIQNEKDLISVYSKYHESCQICSSITVVSKPSKRVYLGTNEIARIYNDKSFTGFYIIPTPKGFVTSDYCLSEGHSGGEILIKVELL